MISPSALVVAPGSTATGPRMSGHRITPARRHPGTSPDTGTDRQRLRNVPRRLAQDLEGFLSDGIPLPATTRIAAALRGFAAGNGYLSGQVIDRAI